MIILKAYNVLKFHISAKNSFYSILLIPVLLARAKGCDNIKYGAENLETVFVAAIFRQSFLTQK